MQTFFRVLKKGGIAAAIAFSISTIVYGNAEYADFGVTELPADWVTYITTALAAIGYPASTEKWTFLKKSPKTQLELLNELEVEVAQNGGPLDHCYELRKFALSKYQPKPTKIILPEDGNNA